MKKKISFIVLFTVLLVAMLVTTAFAYSFTVSLTPSSTTVAPGKEFIVTLKVSNIDAGDSGISALSGVLSYDTSAFEAVTESSIDELSGWTVQYNASTGKITAYKTSFVNSEEEVLQITMKTLSGNTVAGKSGTIKFDSVVATNNETDISAKSVSTSINIGSSSTNKVSNKTNNIVNNTVKNTVKNVVANNTVPPVVNNKVPEPQVENQVEEEIPYTGTTDIVLFGVIGAIVLAIVVYSKYKKVGKE